MEIILNPDVEGAGQEGEVAFFQMELCSENISSISPLFKGHRLFSKE